MDMKFLPTYCDEMIKEILDALSDEDLDRAIDVIKIGYSGYTRKGFRYEIESHNEEIMAFILMTPKNRKKACKENFESISAISISALMYAKHMAEMADIIQLQMHQLESFGTTTKRRAAAAMVRVSHDKPFPPGRKDVMKRLKLEVSERESAEIIKEWLKPT